MTGSNAETHEGSPSLETQVIDIFIDAQETLHRGENLSSFNKNSHIQTLTNAVGQLPVAALAELIDGKTIDDEADDTLERETLKASADLWSGEEQARQLRTLAYSAYCEARDGEVSQLLAGAKITATTRDNPGGLGSAIARSNGIIETSGDSPDTVIGTFLEADTNTGHIVLTADNPTEEIKYWRISLIGIMPGDQQADIEIEEASVTA